MPPGLQVHRSQATYPALWHGAAVLPRTGGRGPCDTFRSADPTAPLVPLADPAQKYRAPKRRTTKRVGGRQGSGAGAGPQPGPCRPSCGRGSPRGARCCAGWPATAAGCPAFAAGGVGAPAPRRPPWRHGAAGRTRVSRAMPTAARPWHPRYGRPTASPDRCPRRVDRRRARSWRGRRRRRARYADRSRAAPRCAWAVQAAAELAQSAPTHPPESGYKPGCGSG